MTYIIREFLRRILFSKNSQHIVNTEVQNRQFSISA